MATLAAGQNPLRSCPTGCRSCSRSPGLRNKSRQSARQEDAKKTVSAVKIAEGIEQHADAVVLIGGFALCEMCADLAGFVMADDGDGEISVVVGEIGGGRFGCGNAIARQVLAKIADRQFHFARTVLEEVFQFGSTVHARNARERECRRVRKRRCALLRGDPRTRQKRKPHPE